MELRQIINQQTEFARDKLYQKVKQNKPEENPSFQGLLFVGNRHESVPLRLLTDKYLTPRAKLAWQMIKLNAQQFQGAAFPSYEELGQWLSDRAFQEKAVSRKIISQTLLLLRLTRWLTLCETVRNERGQVLGNVYIMNDEPLSVLDCLQLNDDYLRLLEKATTHRDPLVQDVAQAIIQDLLTQKPLQHFVSHLSVIKARYAQRDQGFNLPKSNNTLGENLNEAILQTQQILLSSHWERSEKNGELSKKAEKLQSSNRELSQQNDAKSLILDLVPNGNSVNSPYSTNTNKYSTGTATIKTMELLNQFKLSALEQANVSKQLAQLNTEEQDAVLFEFQQRIQQGNVKKPIGYLMSLLQKAVEGNFNPYLIKKSEPQAPQAKPSENRSRQILDNPIAPKPKSSQHVEAMLKTLNQFRANRVLCDSD